MNLETKIELAKNEWNRATELQDAILRLSNNEIATDILAWELRNAALSCESLWQEIEQLDDFKEKYGSDRQRAIEDCLD